MTTASSQISQLPGPGQYASGWKTIHSHPALIAFAQTGLGKLAVFATFVLAMFAGQQISHSSMALIALTVAACFIAPQFKFLIVALSGAVYFCLRPLRTAEQIDFVNSVLPPPGSLGQGMIASYTPAAALFLIGCYGLFRYVRAHPTSFIARRPVVGLLSTLCGLTAVAEFLPAGSMLYGPMWTVALMLAASFFFIAYLLVDARSKADIAPGEALGFVRPFWGGMPIPFKGPSYLRRFEASTALELATVRLRGAKLMIWASIMGGADLLISFVAYDYAGLPTLQAAIADTAKGAGPGRSLAWFVLFKEFITNVLWVGAVTHTAIAVVRICGYGVPRGMARPFTARTIAEFWNRYLFYFKEVLVDFFFYPAFIRFFKKQPKLRIAFATFCAAFVGNTLFAVISQAELMAVTSPAEMFLAFRSYYVYAFALTIALVVSQLRSRKPRPEDGFFRYSVVTRFNVISFFMLVQVFAHEGHETNVVERAEYFFYLFGA